MTTATPTEAASATLIEAARHAEEPPADPRPFARRARVRKVDFARPAKFTSDQERRLERVLDTFCRTASTRLAAEMRMPIELELINLAQLTWAHAHGQLPDGSICGTVVAQPAGTRMLLGAELQLVLAAIERLVGGGGNGPVPERKLTEIDWVVAKLFLDRLVTQLSAVFADAAGLELGLEGVEGHLDSERLTGVSEPTLAATIEVRHDGTSSTVALLLPYAAFAPFAAAFGGAAGDPAADGAAVDAVLAAVADVGLEVAAEVGAVDLPIEAVLAIQPGQVLRLGAPASAGIALAAGGVTVCRAAPGRTGSRRAVQVLP